jgi:hypothetical protein
MTAPAPSLLAPAGTVVRGRFQARLVEYVRATAWLSRRSRVSVGVGLLVLAGAALATGVALADPDDPVLWVSAGAGIVLGAALISGWSCAPGLWLAARRNRRIYEHPTDVVADARGLTMTNGAFVTATPWRLFSSVRENDAYYFLDNGVGGALLVPKRSFAPVDAVRFAALAAAGIAAATPPGSPLESAAREMPHAREMPAVETPHARETPAAPETAGGPGGGAAVDPAAAPERDEAVVHGSFTMTVGEYARASAWLMRRAPSSWLVGFCLVAFGAIELVAWGAAEHPITAAVAVGTVGLGVVLATGLVAGPILWLAGRRRRDLFTQPTTIVATAAGVRITSSLYDNVIAWDALERVRASREHLYLEAGGGQTVVVPLRAFESRDLQHLLGFAAAGRP